MDRWIIQGWAWAILIPALAIHGCGLLPTQVEPDKSSATPSSPSGLAASPAQSAPTQPAPSRPGAAPQSGSAGSPPSPPKSGTPPQSGLPSSSGTPSQTAAPPPAVDPQRDLADGIKLFQRGDFHAAIGKLGGLADLSAASKDVRTMALRYLAFSYCVTRRQAQCQAQFEAALKLDPAFDLAPAERGHPLWGPAFERAKKAQRRPQK